MPDSCVIVFAKAPIAGRVKTRLVEALGAVAAAELASDLLQVTLSEVTASKTDALLIATEPAVEDPAWQSTTLPESAQTITQSRGNLGRRMAAATQYALQHFDRILLVGSDCPSLTAARISASLQALDDADLTITPAADGGYVALGMSSFHECLFDDIPWSEPEVAEITLARASDAQLSVDIQPTLADIDRESDLQHLPPNLAARYEKSGSEQKIA